MLYMEWSRSCFHTGTLIPEDLDMKGGFRSYFKFDLGQKAFIEAQGDMKNLDNIEVYSDTLFIDIDNDRDAMKQCRAILQKKGIGYTLWISGGKGYHFHIALDKTYQDVNLPAIHKQFVQSLGIPVDESIYRHAGIFRLPGTKHKKTGRKKRLLESFQGNLLELDLTLQVEKKLKITTYSYTSEVEALNRALFEAVNEPAMGGRYLTLWKIAKGLHEAEFSESFALELLVMVNSQWSNPKELSEIKRALVGANYGKD